MKTDASFRIGQVPDQVLELIDIVKSEKASALQNLFEQSSKFLTNDLQVDKLKREISETNDKINTIAWSNEFGRELTAGECKDEFFKWGITQPEFNDYVNFSFDLQSFKDSYFNGENVDQEITLPKFQLITDFLGLMDYFDKLNEKLTALERVETPEQPTTVQSKDIDFDKLENSNFPVIDISIFDPDIIFDEYHNKAFTCSRFAFDAWLVYGKVCKEKIKWIYTTRDGKINKAQLKKFIDKITNTDTAKESYFKKVFDIEVKKSDYRDASLNSDFKVLSTISYKKKFKI